ncbi:TspO/MBR family protein [Deinococcus planocerae]|uniref:TspO/MBR family protein n=1 Tax=Deinococcus planocerae TaxID=1737569 RepID=UPI0015E08ACD|nr:TspO/MBR family protein [Deinococcus planocerae]
MTTLTRSRSRSAPRFRWWHALGIFAAANAVSILPAGVNGNEAFYNDFKRPTVAPPDWLFPPMWLFLNVTSLIALARVANDPEQTGDHRKVYVLEGSGWVLFAAFNTVYFGLRSPVLGAADTAAGLAVGAGSLVYSLKVDRRAGLLILPRVLWLLLATYVSVWVARHNRDEFLSRGRS